MEPNSSSKEQLRMCLNTLLNEGGSNCIIKVSTLLCALLKLSLAQEHSAVFNTAKSEHHLESQSKNLKLAILTAASRP